MGTSSETYSPPRTSVKTVSARRRNQHARSVRYPEKDGNAIRQDTGRSAQNSRYSPSREVISGSFFRRKRNQLFQVFRTLSRGVR